MTKTLKIVALESYLLTGIENDIFIMYKGFMINIDKTLYVISLN